VRLRRLPESAQTSGRWLRWSRLSDPDARWFLDPE
jgi:hypothetical protein